MIYVDIFLMIIGIIAIVISRDNGNTQEQRGEVEKESLDAKIDSVIENRMEEVLNQTDDKLSAISNDKIMGLSEYSNQIFDKMEKNHGEVVFLYNMLNEKEEEIKKLVHDVDTMKAQMRDDAVLKYQEIKRQIAEIEEKKERLSIDMDYSFDASVNRQAIYDAEIARIEEEEKMHQFFPMKEPVLEAESRDITQERDEEAVQTAMLDSGIHSLQEKWKREEKKDTEENHNNEILSLYRKGRSILDISKMLSLGQGEVKFVIDFFEGRS